MTEKRSCVTCGFSKIDCSVIGVCIGFDKWQPIINTKVQHTSEEWTSIIDDLGCNPDVMVELKQKGYIRKSELVELVEEAEWIYENYQSAKYCLTTDEALEKNHDALQALKKDHPEFGGKK